MAVLGFGEWRIEHQHPGAAPLLVAMGILASMGDGEVAQQLLAGFGGLVLEHLYGELGAFRVACLYSKWQVVVRGGAQSGKAGMGGSWGR